jgi:hypothetical protein
MRFRVCEGKTPFFSKNLRLSTSAQKWPQHVPTFKLKEYKYEPKAGGRASYLPSMALYENVVEEILNKDEFTQKIFLGAFARNESPNQPPYPSCFNVNTEPRSKSGGHWLALYYRNTGLCSFFDSYGNDPAFYRLQSYIQRTANFWLCNKT